MKESISYTYLLNMMLVFIVISFCVIMAVISYSKAYRINSKIASALEEAEGYNDIAKTEISRLISAFGYQRPNVNCKSRENAELVSEEKGYCIYYYDTGDYYYYGITTYMMFDFPIVDLLKIPVYNTTEKIYKTSVEVE